MTSSQTTVKAEGSDSCFFAIEKSSLDILRDTYKTREITCGKCGLTGHNQRTCGKPKKPKAKKAKKAKKTCKGCKRKTVQLDGFCSDKCKEKKAIELSLMEPKKKKKCSQCGELGHNIRTCEYGYE